MPHDRRTVPGRTTPAPTAAQVWSCPPSATGIPAGKPSAPAASEVSSPASAPEGSARLRRSSSTPMSSNSSRDQLREWISNISVREAFGWSRVAAPVRRSMMKSSTIAKRAVLRYTSGRCSRSHTMVMAAAYGPMRAPVIFCQSRGESAASSGGTRSAARVSIQVRAGASGRALPSTGTIVSPWVDTARARTLSPPASATTCLAAATTLVHQSSAFCSDHPGRGLEMPYSTPASATACASSSTNSAFTAVVPTSMPSSKSRTSDAALQGECVFVLWRRKPLADSKRQTRDNRPQTEDLRPSTAFAVGVRSVVLGLRSSV